MTDEPETEGQEPESPATVAENAPEAAEGEAEQSEEQAKKLHQSVEMRDVGPCKKHIKVTVQRADIDKLLDKKFSEMVVETPVPGFRPGKAPRKIIERRFHKDVTE